MASPRYSPLLAFFVGIGCLAEPQIDLEAPQLLRLELAGGIRLEAGRRLSTAPVFELLASEPLDPESIGPGSLVLRSLASEESCGPRQPCEEGRCRFGACQLSDLTSTQLTAIGRGDYEVGSEAFGREAPLVWELLEGVGGAPSRLRLWPTRALRGDTSYELLVGGLRDRSGIPLNHWLEDESLLRWPFDTRAEGSGGPELHFARPLAGSATVPTNLDFIDTTVVGELSVDALAGTEATLESERGERVELREPSPCPESRPGSCLRWRVASSFDANTRYRIGPAQLQDPAGRRALLPADGAWFRTGEGRDDTAPQLEVWTAERGHCVELSVRADEFVHAEVEVAGQMHRRWFEGRWSLGLQQLETGEPTNWALQAVDLAGNEGGAMGELVGPTHERSGLVISEVLANPLGAEPAAEFVELFVTSQSAVETEGMYLADLPWEEVRAAIEAGEGPPGDQLPSSSLQPGELALVVADAYPGAEPAGDAVAPDSVQRLRIGTSLGEGGLKNVGEALTLYRLEPLTLLSSYGNWIETDASDLGGVSVQRRAPEACDLAADWQLAPSGLATPGTLP